uniref:Uncharacterized protein n=1 Tax=Tetraselmis sp. GSL018 TaxID=582737 RepID=A0A061QW50_9CHLO
MCSIAASLRGADVKPIAGQASSWGELARKEVQLEGINVHTPFQTVRGCAAAMPVKLSPAVLKRKANREPLCFQICTGSYDIMESSRLNSQVHIQHCDTDQLGLRQGMIGAPRRPGDVLLCWYGFLDLIRPRRR